MSNGKAASVLLRKIPPVDRLMASNELAAILERYPRQLVVSYLRQLLAEVRQQAIEDKLEVGSLETAQLANVVQRRLDSRRPYYRRVINATGVILHTGLGRAPLAPAAVEALSATAGHPQRVEVRLADGQRGGRDYGCAQLLCELTGCEAATVVNNNAAATLLILAAMSRGREVILSRGEMVEIGGSYRIPDILEESGCHLVEVGTTNRTRADDYRRAISDETGLLLKVHTSNYRVVGFTGEVELAELVEIGRAAGVPVVHDLGSGSLIDLDRHGRPGEHPVRQSLLAGADLVCFSGDKLLGGPQAGILAGTAAAVDRCRRHPLFRALRPGRLTYTALEATLQLYLDDPDAAAEQIPAIARLTAEESQLESRARKLAESLGELPALEIRVAPSLAQAGSGSLPARDYRSWALCLIPRQGNADQLAESLRQSDPPVLGRLHEGALWLDLRTLGDEDLEPLKAILQRLGKART